MCVFLFLYWKLIFQDLAVISLYKPRTIVFVVKIPYHYYSTFRIISVFFYYMRICPRRIYVHLLVHVCLVNIQNLVQPLSFQCLYQKHNHLKSYITNNFTVQALIGGHLCYVTITYTAIQYTVIKYLNNTAFWYLF